MRLQVHRGVRDVDRVVVDRDLALVLRRLLRIEDYAPGLRGGRHILRVPHQEVRPTAVRDAVVGAVERVVRLVLQVVEDGLVVGDQIRVDRGHVAALEEPRGRVARGRDAVVLAGPHQLHHLVRRAGHLDLDVAAGLLLEARDPVGAVGPILDVPGPRDQVDLALLLGGRLAHALQRLAVAVVRASASAPDREHQRDHRHDNRPRRACGVDGEPCSHLGSSSLELPSVTATVCSDRHPTVTPRPRCSSASAEDVSRFWRTT